MTALVKNILFALVLGIILWVGYVAFFKNDDVALDTSGSLGGEAAIEAQIFLARLQQLETVNLSNELFGDVRFQSLRDLRRDIIDEPSGRPNPFAPIGQ